MAAALLATPKPRSLASAVPTTTGLPKVWGLTRERPSEVTASRYRRETSYRLKTGQFWSLNLPGTADETAIRSACEWRSACWRLRMNSTVTP